MFRKIMRLEGKWSVDLEKIHVWSILLSSLLPRIVTLPSRMRGGGGGWRVCTGRDVGTIWNDNIWEQWSRAAPAPLWPVAALLKLQHGCQFVPAPGALFVMVTRLFGPGLRHPGPPSSPSSVAVPSQTRVTCSVLDLVMYQQSGLCVL